MAVVQISKIQVRRGKKNAGSGLPQLSSGEIGWAIDTREMFIGNGAVAEGSPAVGNTKVLTQYDDLFSLADTYTYKKDESYLVTGTSASSPVKRKLQDRLDDQVYGDAFGLTGIETQNATALLQRALDQLYLNDSTKGNVNSRVTLNLRPGIYTINATIYIPPHVTLVGAGSDKTIIKCNTVSTTLIQTVDSTSTPGNPVTSDASTTTLNQSTNLHIKGITFETSVTNTGLLINNVKDSVFEDVKIMGPWQTGDTLDTDGSDDVAIKINSKSSSVESKNIRFINCKIEGFSYGLTSNWDIHDNIFEGLNVKSCGYGLTFGHDMVIDSSAGSGKLTGPKNNIITNSVFEDIDYQAIWIQKGVNNISKNNNFFEVGNAGGNEGSAQSSVIKFTARGNVSKDDIFARTKVQSIDQTYINSSAFVPEVEGSGFMSVGETQRVTITNGSLTKLFRLGGVAHQSFEIDYIITSQNYTAIRSGILSIVSEDYSDTVSTSDEYTFQGTATYDSAITFGANISDYNSDLTNDTINVIVTSTMPSDDQSIMEFRIRAKKN
tara:strand:+ start:9855 stop:11504 length:1650 start_codon:yes stop_codon:yes gene_type:complete